MFKDIYICTPLDIRNTVACVINELHGIAEERAFGVRLVLNELLANSITHSNGTRTKLSYRLNDNTIECTIADDGEWCASPAICCSRTDMDHGRGVYLANCYAESLKYDEEHRMVCFEIRIR